MISALVHTELGLDVRRVAADCPSIANREILPEPRYFMRARCCRCDADLGRRECIPEQTGKVTHGFCQPCYERAMAEIREEAAK
jgi:hypothetical protein